MKILKIMVVFVCLLAFLNEKAWAQQNPKVLVVYYSRTGTTRKVAERLAEKFNADVQELIDRKKRIGPLAFLAAGKDATVGNLTEIDPLSRDPKEYDMILIGTPSWYSNMTPAVRTFVTQNPLSFQKLGVFATAHLTGAPKALEGLAQLLSPQEASAIPRLPLFKKDIKDERALRQKIDTFYQKMMALP